MKKYIKSFSRRSNPQSITTASNYSRMQSSCLEFVIQRMYKARGWEHYTQQDLALLKSKNITELSDWRRLTQTGKELLSHTPTNTLPVDLISMLDKCSTKLDWKKSKETTDFLLDLFPTNYNTTLTSTTRHERNTTKMKIWSDIFDNTFNRYLKRNSDDPKFHNIIFITHSDSQLTMKDVILNLQETRNEQRQTSTSCQNMSTPKEWATNIELTSFLDGMEHSICIDIDFNKDEPQGIDLSDGQHGLGRRIIYEYFIHQNDLPLSKFDILIGDNYPTITDALEIIRDHQREIVYPRKQVFLFVRISGCEKYCNRSRECWDEIILSIGSIMTTHHHRLFFQPLFTSSIGDVEHLWPMRLTNSIHHWDLSE